MTATSVQKYLTERQAADYLGFSPNTLRHSRWTGQLAGVPAPRHLKLGRSVRYQPNELDRWVKQLAEGDV